MFFSTITFMPLFWLINPFDLFRRLQRWMKYGRKDLTQEQANTLMEDTHYDIGKRYAEVIKVVWFTFLYQSLIPFGAFLSTLGLLLYYWIDKYNLLRRSVLKVNLSSKIPLAFLSMLEWCLVFQPVGSLIFDGFIREYTALNLAPSIVMIVCGLIYVLVPKNEAINCCFNEKFNL